MVYDLFWERPRTMALWAGYAWALECKNFVHAFLREEAQAEKPMQALQFVPSVVQAKMEIRSN